MKFLIVALIFTSPFAMANKKCLEDAKLQARLYSARQNHVSVNRIKATDAFFHDQTRNVYYYAVVLDNYEQVNVGLTKRDCTLYRISDATDEM